MKRVFARDRSLAGLFRVPWAELTIAMNFADWLGIGQQRVKRCGVIQTEPVQSHFVDRELGRRLSRIYWFSQEHDQSVLRVDFIDHKRILLRKIYARASNHRRTARNARRCMNLQSLQADP